MQECHAVVHDALVWQHAHGSSLVAQTLSATIACVATKLFTMQPTDASSVASSPVEWFLMPDPIPVPTSCPFSDYSPVQEHQDTRGDGPTAEQDDDDRSVVSVCSENLRTVTRIPDIVHIGTPGHTNSSGSSRRARTTQSISMSTTTSSMETQMPTGHHPPFTRPTVMTVSTETPGLLTEQWGHCPRCQMRAMFTYPQKGPWHGVDSIAFGFLADMGEEQDDRMWVDNETTDVQPLLRRTNLVFHEYAYENGLAGRIRTQFPRNRHVCALRWYYIERGRPRLYVMGYAEMRFHMTANAELIFRRNGMFIMEQLRDKMRREGLEAF